MELEPSPVEVDVSDPLRASVTHYLQREVLEKMVAVGLKSVQQLLAEVATKPWIDYITYHLSRLDYEGLEFDPFQPEAVLDEVLARMYAFKILYPRRRRRCNLTIEPFYITLLKVVTFTSCQFMREQLALRAQSGPLSLMAQPGVPETELINLSIPPIAIRSVLDMDECEFMCDDVLNFLLNDPDTHRQLLWQMHAQMPAFETEAVAAAFGSKQRTRPRPRTPGFAGETRRERESRGPRAREYF